MRNMILTVGAGTPASYLWTEVLGEEQSVRRRMEDSSSDDEDDDEEEEGDDDEVDLPYFSMTAMDDEEESDGQSNAEQGDHTDDMSESSAVNESAVTGTTSTTIEASSSRAVPEEHGAGNDTAITKPTRPTIYTVRRRYDPARFDWSPSLRHGGCINTACWMNDDHILMTSGDDRCIKLWDVTGSAIGMASPLPGGWDTWSPLALQKQQQSMEGDKHYLKGWNEILLRDEEEPEIDDNNIELPPPGGVKLLQTLETGHRGNVFHITPCHGDTKILSSGADGYLRLIDREHGSSSVIIDPERLGGSSMFTMEMAFCHTPLTIHTGLMCCGQGLLRYDVRAPRTEQRLLDTSSKAVAVWPPIKELHETTEPNMVFVGGFEPTVELLDLRMDGSATQTASVVERYWYGAPDRTPPTDNGVSVSGIDISKDGRQLLVSYESDQIYTFPILGSHNAGPTLSDIETSTAKFSTSSTGPSNDISPSASYGGHFNRLTFLKNAKFAGPNDDYIVTGSDSGHAFFFDRSSGAVTALLAADATICNGVLPHPTLPVFCTYGIASTARLWRAAPCVDRRVDDSPSGRYQAFLQQQDCDDALPTSLVADDWDKTQLRVARGQQYVPCFLPDFAMTAQTKARAGGLGLSRSETARRRIGSASSPCLGNALLRLPHVLRGNLSLLCTSAFLATQTPVEQAIPDFVQTIIRHRTKLQADRLGLRWNPGAPWVLDNKHNPAVHKADLIPENPSDWILSNPFMASCISQDVAKTIVAPIQPPWLRTQQVGNCIDVDDSQPAVVNADARMEHICLLLLNTAQLAKEGGNDALRKADQQKAENLDDSSLLSVAARRYNVACQYCAVLLVDHRHDKPLQQFKECSSNWDPLPIRRVLIATRLNLSMLLLRMGHCGPAAAHADEAIQFLSKHNPMFPTEEETAKMTAKAHFRLGSVLFKVGKLEDAAEQFKESLDNMADKVVRRRLQEVQSLRRKAHTTTKRQRKRMRKMWQDQN